MIAVTTKTIVRELAIDRLDCDIRHRGEWLCSTLRLVWHPGGVVGNHEPAVATLLVNLRLDDGEDETRRAVRDHACSDAVDLRGRAGARLNHVQNALDRLSVRDSLTPVNPARSAIFWTATPPNTDEALVQMTALPNGE